MCNHPEYTLPMNGTSPFEKKMTVFESMLGETDTMNTTLEKRKNAPTQCK